MSKIYFTHISEVLPLSLTMVTITIFDITYYDFPWQNGSILFSDNDNDNDNDKYFIKHKCIQ